MDYVGLDKKAKSHKSKPKVVIDGVTYWVTEHAMCRFLERHGKRHLRGGGIENLFEVIVEAIRRCEINKRVSLDSRFMIHVLEKYGEEFLRSSLVLTYEDISFICRYEDHDNGRDEITVITTLRNTDARQVSLVDKNKSKTGNRGLSSDKGLYLDMQEKLKPRYEEVMEEKFELISRDVFRLPTTYGRASLDNSFLDLMYDRGVIKRGLLPNKVQLYEFLLGSKLMDSLCRKYKNIAPEANYATIRLKCGALVKVSGYSSKTSKGNVLLEVIR